MAASANPPDGNVSELSAVDVFLLFNDQEAGMEAIVEGLESRGLKVHYFPRDIAPGARFKEIEAQRLRSARAVIIVLGEKGWGPTQLKLLGEARELGKSLLPVLFGKPPVGALDLGEGLFNDQFYVDLSELDGAGFDKLASAVAGQPGPAPRFDQVIGTLIDGTDLQREVLLGQLIREQLPEAPSLAAQLRQQIREEFGPEQESLYERGRRDTSRFSSIRTWMLSTLVWLDAEHPESRELIFRHLDPSFEKERPVRFWCLGSLARRQPDYLSEAVARAVSDPSPEVADLARAIRNPDDPSLLNQFRSDLGSETFTTAWHVLRLLRLIALPQLAADVCAQLTRRAEDHSLAYDALFALANPEMAVAARDILVETPGLDQLALIVVEESRQSNPVAVRSFAYFLTVFDRAQMRPALERAAANAGDRRLVGRILEHMAEIGQSEEGGLYIAGYTPDTIDISKDDIGIARDVETLAAVMLAREFHPPLAIGLFGAWGSGKSFFMQSIEAKAEQIAKEARSKRSAIFCGNIAQIRFNAWHYSDTHLWASLVSHILDQLSAKVTPGLTAAEQQALLKVQLDSAKGDLAAASADRARAQKILDDAQQKLGELRVERERKEVKLRDLRSAELVRLLDDDGDLKTQLTEALDQVGAPAAVESVNDLNRVVEESYSVGGRAAALLVGLANGQNRATVLLCVLAVLAAPVLAWAVMQMVDGGRLGVVSATAAEFVAVAGAAAALLRRALGHAKAGLDKLSAAKRKVDELIARKRAEPGAEENELEREIASARAGEQGASERMAAASAQAVEIENRVKALEESQSLAHFLTERTRSEDYRRHLGLISTIRKDFEALVTRLQRPPAGGRSRVDRIILYIDDLDRCPANVVVDVLQAVHLLLAYPLFVVVVSVDPRWLLRSLETRYRHFKRDGSSTALAWQSTPQDYLEKIFQIPFSVRPMGEGGFTNLMDRMLAAGDGSASKAEGHQRRPGEEKTDSSGAETADSETVGDSSTGQGKAGTKSSRSDNSGSSAEAQPPQLEMLEEALVIRPVEQRFAKRLHPFIPTPRAAKRFTNVYRLLKAPIVRSQLKQHEGSLEIPGDFQLPMLLLALLVGRPDEAAEIFPQFLASARAGRREFWTAPAGAKEPAEMTELRAAIARIASEEGFRDSPELMREWLPRVARFSFGTARLAAEE